MPKSLVAGLGGKFPESEVLFDDTFDDGFNEWQELHTNTQVSTTGPTIAPLSLRHPSIPGSCLSLTTASVPDPGIHSQSVAMKRLGYWFEPAIVDFEVWFAYGSESDDNAGPRFLTFMVDEMYGGQRHFWKWRWRNWNESGAVRAANWYLSSQGEDNYVDTGHVSDFPWNGNKGSQNYARFSLDLANRVYLPSQVNRDTFDFGATVVTPPGDNGVPEFDDPLFENGLNFMFAVTNRSNQSIGSWMAVTRTRASVRSA